MRTFFLVLAAAGLAQASLRLSPGEIFSFAIPGKPQFLATGSFRIDLRIHDWRRPGPDVATNLVNLPPGVQIRLAGIHFNGPLAITDWADFFGTGLTNAIYFDISKRRDFLLRIQRDLTARFFTAELWNADGSGYERQRLDIERTSDKPSSGSGEIGGSASECDLAYLLWNSKLQSIGSLPFSPGAPDLAGWYFDRSLAGTSSIALHGGKAAFVDPPAYPPFVSQGETRILHVGRPEKLDGSASRSLTGGGLLAYTWSQLSGPATLRWTAQSTATPTVDGIAFGEYRIELKVTDKSGRSSTSTLTYGAVHTGSQDVVVPEEAEIGKLLGPLLRWGASPWLYFDRRNAGLANFFGALQEKEYPAVWNNPLPGSISVRKGSSTITGQGTSFRTTVCPPGKGNATLVIWYPVPGTHGGFGRHPFAVASCQSDTSLTLARPYQLSDDGDGWKYSAMDENTVGKWINGSTNVNYYDNVLAFYSLYSRTGIEKYRTYARTLADRWWTMPWIDEGRSAESGDGSIYLFPRVKSVTGLIVRALDGRPEMWPGIRALADADYRVWLSKRDTTDMREEGYATAIVSLIAMFDPDSAYRAKYKAQVERAISLHWAPNQLPDGSWKNISFGHASWNGLTGSATVSNGSRTVTGQGTHWQPDWFKENAFWTANQDFSNGDKRFYRAECVSPTELRLDRPYEGPSASGRAWEASNLVGYGTEPFLLGLVATAFRYAYVATGDPRPRQWIIDIAGWSSREGIRPSTKGLWYARVFPNCEPIRDGNPWCAAESVDESRALAGPVANTYSWAYLFTKDAAVRAAGDRLFGAMYGKDGGPDSDAHYIDAIDAGGWDEQTKKAKDFGIFFGWGFGASWPAARLAR